ncbi:MAG: SRPBCC family protein [Cryomorphaceae bacterium]
MGKVDIRQSIEINVSANKAWEVIGPNFLNIADWGRGVKKSWNNEALKANHDGAPAGGRFCDLGTYGIVEESILHYDRTGREITWSAKSDKLPGFIKNLQNALKVEALDANTCRATTNITADAAGIGGLLMGGMVKKNFSKQLGGFIKDWKSYAETGEASEAKKRELKRD